MKSIKMNFKILLVPIVAASMILTSCNKDLESFAVPTAPVVTPPTGTTISSYISTNSNYSFFDTALRATGLYAAVLNQPGAYTVFAPDNNAIKALINGLNPLVPLGAPDATFITVIKDPSVRAQLTSVLLYHIMVSKLPTANFPTAFPNAAFSSKIPLDASGAIRMNLFPSARPGQNYVNNVPITAPDLFTGSNGVVHGIPAPLVPPTLLLGQIIDANANLTYLKAAIARADSGVAAGSTLDAATRNGLANLTVFAPSDAAFKAALTAVVYVKLVRDGATPGLATQTQAATTVNTLGTSIFTNPAFFSALSAQTVKGIVVYHILGVRAYASNMPAVATNIPTLLNSALPTHEGIKLQSTFTGAAPFVATALNVTGKVSLVDGSTNFSGPAATATTKDINAVNGVVHIIDQVLVPQGL
ncbi:fasciclin domain-containing protein [Ferruginibacter lapsinanis]|uniref:fasciclin domain-containing protein n=1 Tax=Ferruginibacter lapsinanis TaxID=563172 RepID=UPI001E36751E|nr:fasciclin domain-containing protein [Ferruginibacter lapsinanis]UEG48917.1 fasciclin domain-containing protein [Ferruginibacter lapsinanis]